MRALAEAGAPFVGVLYAGLFITRDGPRVIEFNCRWGDPETQLLMPLLESDLVDLSLACIEGRLDEMSVEWSPGVALGVALASAGYPTSPRKGDRIAGLDDVDAAVHLFHAATRFQDDAGQTFVTDGGRVLTVVATGATLAEARARAYNNVARIDFEGMQYRQDLGAEHQGGGALTPSTTPIISSEAAQPVAAIKGAPDPTPSTRVKPRVAILIASESDRELMTETAKVLETFGIEHEMHVMSAHRTPSRVTRFAREAEGAGIKVIVAAGALPGAVSANTTLPVIGVPIAGSSLMGLDALFAMVQMPPGVPVATVAISTAGARNAGYLAASIIALADDEVRACYRKFREEQSGEAFP